MTLKTNASYPIACHSCTSEAFVGRMSFKDNFDREKYEAVIRCENCGEEVRQLKGKATIETYDADGNFIESGVGELPERP